MKVLVVRQPWAWLIVNGHKDVENRSWATLYRGPLLIQASAARPSKALIDYARKCARAKGVDIPDEYETGGIVGIASLDDCTTRRSGKWHDQGQIAWKLSGAKTLRFIPMIGRLRLIDPPEAIRRRVLRQLRSS